MASSRFTLGKIALSLSASMPCAPTAVPIMLKVGVIQGLGFLAGGRNDAERLRIDHLVAPIGGFAYFAHPDAAVRRLRRRRKPGQWILSSDSWQASPPKQMSLIESPDPPQCQLA